MLTSTPLRKEPRWMHPLCVLPAHSTDAASILTALHRAAEHVRFAAAAPQIMMDSDFTIPGRFWTSQDDFLRSNERRFSLRFCRGVFAIDCVTFASSTSGSRS